jgi:hypothetical protein
MDNSIVIDVFVDYLILNARQIFKDNIKILSKIPVNQLSSFVLENYYELIVANLRLVSKNILSVIDFNDLFKRKKSAELLDKTLNYLTYSFADAVGSSFYPIGESIETKEDFKYVLNSIYNIATGCDRTYDHYKRNCTYFYQDKLNPLRHCKLYMYQQYKSQIKASTMLSMALDHAEKHYSIAIAREIDDFY